MQLCVCEAAFSYYFGIPYHSDNNTQYGNDIFGSKQGRFIFQFVRRPPLPSKIHWTVFGIHP